MKVSGKSASRAPASADFSGEPFELVDRGRAVERDRLGLHACDLDDVVHATSLRLREARDERVLGLVLELQVMRLRA